MRLASILKGGQRTISVVSADGSHYWPVNQFAPDFAGDMIKLVQQFDAIKSKIDLATGGTPLDAASLLAPIDEPRRNIFCVGKNYHDHAAEFQNSGFDHSAKNGEHAPEAP